MKNLTKIFLSIVLILVLPAMIYGQGPEKAVHIDVEGIEPGTKITYSEFVSRFGKPDSYRKYESEFGLSERYIVGKTSFPVKRMEFSTTFACTTTDSVH